MDLEIPEAAAAIGFPVGGGPRAADGLNVTVSAHLEYDDGRFAPALSSIDALVYPAASIGGTLGAIVS